MSQNRVELNKIVTPAKAGVQVLDKLLNKVCHLDPGLRRDDEDLKVSSLYFEGF